MTCMVSQGHTVQQLTYDLLLALHSSYGSTLNCFQDIMS